MFGRHHDHDDITLSAWPPASSLSDENIIFHPGISWGLTPPVSLLAPHSDDEHSQACMEDVRGGNRGGGGAMDTPPPPPRVSDEHPRVCLMGLTKGGKAGSEDKGQIPTKWKAEHAYLKGCKGGKGRV